MKRMLIGIGLVALLAACQSTTPTTKVDARDPNPGSSTSTNTPPKTDVPTQTQPPIGKPGDDLRNPNSILSKRVIYFDYDTDAVKSEYAALIQAHANYLSQNRNRKVRLEGHADERGSREYNMALGQRTPTPCAKRPVHWVSATTASKPSASVKTSPRQRATTKLPGRRIVVLKLFMTASKFR